MVARNKLLAAPPYFAGLCVGDMEYETLLTLKVEGRNYKLI